MSRRRHPSHMNKPYYPLITSDIEKCKHGSSLDEFYKSATRKDFREINKTNDIPGATTGSLKKGI